MAPSRFLRAAVFTLPLLSFPALALPPPDEPWIQVRSPSFLLFSNAGERQSRGITTDLERLRSALGQLNPELALSSPQPTYIHIFRNEESFRPYKLLYNGKPLAGEGYFVSHPEANYMAIEANGDERAVVYHEYLHSILRNTYPGLPLWFNEGLAEYYSTFRVGSTDAWIGTAISDHVLWLRRHAMIPLRELFAMDQSSKDYNEGNRRGVFYAQSWALTHYLLDTDPELRTRTLAYLQEVARGKAVGPDALLRFLGVDEQALERNLRIYVTHAVYRGRSEPLRAESDFVIQTDPLSRADSLVRLGELLLRTSNEQRTGEAAEHFRAALAGQPDHPRALAGLGRIEELSGHRDEAHALYEKAARLAPDDFTLHFRLAVNLLEPDTDGTRLPQARAALERVIALRPGYAEAWGRLAQVLSLMDLPPAEAVPVFETAHRLLPDHMDLAYNLALAYAEAGDRPRAEELIEKILVPRAPDLVEDARDAVLLGERRQIEKLIDEGKLAEAVPQLEALLPRAHTDRRREELRRRVEEVRYALNYDQFGDGYNRAIEYISAGNSKAAIELLEDLISTTMDAGQLQEAEELLARAQAGPKGKK